MTNQTRSRRHRLFLAAVLVCAAARAAQPDAARAASVGVNFGGGPPSYSALAATDSAGAAPYAQTNFNNVAALLTTVLKDNSGTATSVQLTVSSGSSFYYAGSTTPAGPDEHLNNGVAYVTGGSQSFTLANIPYAQYSLVVYGLNAFSGGTQSIAEGGTTYYLSSPNYNAAGYIDGNAATPFTYTQATSTNPSKPTANSDYVVFTGLSGSSLSFTNTAITDTYGFVGGFQLVEVVPEPSTWALLAVGTAALGLALRRRRAAIATRV